MRATPLTVKKNNSKTPLPASMFILQKKLFHVYNYKSTGETSNK